MAHLQMDIPEDVNTIIADAVGSGEFATNSDVVAEAMRLWFADRAASDLGDDLIGRKWDEAMAANGPYHDPDAVLDRLEKKYSAMAEPEG